MTAQEGRRLSWFLFRLFTYTETLTCSCTSEKIVLLFFITLHESSRRWDPSNHGSFIMVYNILDLFYFGFYNGHYYVSDKRNIERKIFNEKYLLLKLRMSPKVSTFVKLVREGLSVFYNYQNISMWQCDN